jgi:Zn-dependent M28 family amino/carboxypeptidase
VLAGEIGVRALGVGDSLARAEAWLRHELESLRFEVRAQRIDTADGTSHNLEVIVPGRDPTLPAIVVGAHYDSYAATPGADDNASGVAALLEIARSFAGASPRRTIRLVCFANEEPPYFQCPGMGSLEYARALQGEGVALHGMISLESIGYYDASPGSQRFPAAALRLFYPDRGDYVAFVGDSASREWVDRVVGAFRAHAEVPSEAFSGPRAIPGVDWSDHWSFWSHGYRALMVTDTATYRNPNYHEPGDLPATLDYQTLAGVVRGLTAALREIAEE